LHFGSQFYAEHEKEETMRLLHHIVAAPAGILFVLLIAAALEVLGDACFQTAVHRSSGLPRWIWFAVGALILALYGFLVNQPPWDFGRLLGLYVVFFFVIAQIVARLRFHQSISLSTLLGGSLIVAGGVVLWWWK
jgi:drug/metabolite transporter superfamily protein YnfA